MGQGTNTKIAQLVSNAFGLSYEKVKISSTNTSKVPNTSASAASSTTDLNGAAALNACLLYTSPSPRDGLLSRMPSSA